MELLISYGILSILISMAIFILAVTDNKESKEYMYWGCPKYIYNHSKLNIFGVMLVYLFFFILFPIYYVLWFIYWLVHVGRKV